MGEFSTDWPLALSTSTILSEGHIHGASDLLTLNCVMGGESHRNVPGSDCSRREVGGGGRLGVLKIASHWSTGVSLSCTNTFLNQMCFQLPAPLMGGIPVPKMPLDPGDVGRGEIRVGRGCCLTIWSSDTVCEFYRKMCCRVNQTHGFGTPSYVFNKYGLIWTVFVCGAHTSSGIGSVNILWGRLCALEAPSSMLPQPLSTPESAPGFEWSRCLSPARGLGGKGKPFCVSGKPLQ